MKVSLTGVTSLVMEYARTLVVGVVFPHFNGTFAGVVLLAVWGAITCFVTSRGLGLLVRVGELRAKTYLSPGSGAALGGGGGIACFGFLRIHAPHGVSHSRIVTAGG
jgi:hypothetical protein